MNPKIITEKLLKKRKLNQFNSYMRFKIQQKNNNNYSPDNNGKKFLIIIACHCENEIKIETIRKNLLYFAFENCHKIVINSSNLPFTSRLQEICNKHNNTKYIEISNNSYVDFGKWIWALKNYNYNDYDYVVFTNDSYNIHSSINHFLNLTAKYNVELYGYNDSTQNKYHYQSYLFSLRKDAIPIFINRVENPTLNIDSQQDVITHFELNLADWFTTHKSFLTIGNFGLQKNHNIFFNNDELYLPLKKKGILPFTKVKRIN